MIKTSQPDNTSLSAPTRKFMIWLVAGVFLTNLVIILIGIQSLIYSRERTVEQVRNTTSNLAALLAPEHRRLGAPDRPGPAQHCRHA